MSDVARLLLESAEGSFLQVGVFVGAMLLFFGYLNYRAAGGLIDAIRRYERFQVPMGAALGASPGCGGAIFVMPLYLRGTISYGTVVATLIATMGDSSFVIISKMPLQAVSIHVISLVVGILAGYIIDAFGIGAGLVEPEEAGAAGSGPSSHGQWPHLGHTPGDRIDEALHPEGHEVPGTVGYEITHRGYVVYWVVCAVGFALGVILLAQRDVGQWLGFDLNRVVGLTGLALSVVWLIAGCHTVAADTHAELEEKVASLKETFIHDAHETAFVTFWVFVAYAAYALFMHFTQLDLQALVAQAGVLPVVATACIGLIPGCGPQIVIVTLYTEGVIPFSALVAHTLSQDGDALFPIIAMSPRVALRLTITTTVPALVVGVLFYALGM
ncbi:MAG: putative manganese transporter [Armatimonadota bacterium]|nr:putative manganese transporter [Armatimonadota bacterium]